MKAYVSRPLFFSIMHCKYTFSPEVKMQLLRPVKCESLETYTKTSFFNIHKKFEYHQNLMETKAEEALWTHLSFLLSIRSMWILWVLKGNQLQYEFFFFLIIGGRGDTAGIRVEEWAWTLPKDDFPWEESFKLSQSFSEGQNKHW